MRAAAQETVSARSGAADTWSLAELRLVVCDSEWQQQLANCAGVYSVEDRRTGRTYIGSAFGAWGLRARLQSHAATVHGCTGPLIELLDAASSSGFDLHFTVLEVMPRSTPRVAVAAREAHWLHVVGPHAVTLGPLLDVN